MSYQGWANHATWCVNLWISNEESSYLELKAMADEAKDNNRTSDDDECDDYDKEECVRELADAIKQWIEDSLPIDTADLCADLLTSALSDVDWAEIAEAALED